MIFDIRVIFSVVSSTLKFIYDKSEMRGYLFLKNCKINFDKRFFFPKIILSIILRKKDEYCIIITYNNVIIDIFELVFIQISA